MRSLPDSVNAKTPGLRENRIDLELEALSATQNLLRLRWIDGAADK
jgi:hypothetical protein